jgi:hypothetical protein
MLAVVKYVSPISTFQDPNKVLLKDVAPLNILDVSTTLVIIQLLIDAPVKLVAL